MIFSFLSTHGSIDGCVVYNSLLYDQITIERLSSHLAHLLETVLSNVDITISAVELLSPREKHELLLHVLDEKDAETTLSAIRRDFLQPIRILFEGRP